MVCAFSLPQPLHFLLLLLHSFIHGSCWSGSYRHCNSGSSQRLKTWTQPEQSLLPSHDWADPTPHGGLHSSGWCEGVTTVHPIKAEEKKKQISHCALLETNLQKSREDIPKGKYRGQVQMLKPKKQEQDHK